MNISAVNSNNITEYANCTYPISVDNKSELIGEDSKLSSGKDQDLSQEFDKNELDKSLVKLNKFLEDDKVHAEYSVHDTFSTVMIKIVDDKTKQVILEIPPKKILDMIASMCKQFGILDKKA